MWIWYWFGFHFSAYRFLPPLLRFICVVRSHGEKRTARRPQACSDMHPREATHARVDEPTHPCTLVLLFDFFGFGENVSLSFSCGDVYVSVGVCVMMENLAVRLYSRSVCTEKGN